MSKKEEMSSAMDQLFNGMPRINQPSQVVASPPEDSTPAGNTTGEKPKSTSRRGRPKRSEKYDTVTVTQNMELYEKMRIIAQRSGLKIKDVNEKFQRNGVQAYERKYGVIRIPQSGKVDLDSVFE